MMNPDNASAAPSDLAALLIPAGGDKYLLLPGVTIAEVIHYEAPVLQDDHERPEWFLGRIEWRTQMIPLVSYEVLNGQPAEQGPNAHIAVLNGSEDPERLPFYAMLTQATPRLLRIGSEDMAAETDASLGAMDLLQARVNGELATIPDVAGMERAILEHGIAG